MARKRIFRMIRILGRNLVGLARFELATTGLGNRCSIHLSYSPASLHYITICPLASKPLDGPSLLIKSAGRRRRIRVGLQTRRNYFIELQALENARPIFFTP